MGGFQLFLPLGFLVRHSLSKLHARVVPNNTTPNDFKKKKKKNEVRTDWWYFRVNRIRTHGVTVLRHLGIFAGMSSEAQGMSANEG